MFDKNYERQVYILFGTNLEEFKNREYKIKNSDRVKPKNVIY